MKIQPEIKRPRGRPNEGRRLTFRLMLTEEERERLQKLAEEQGMTPSQFMRYKTFDQRPG